jgi:hypothetical protein
MRKTVSMFLITIILGAFLIALNPVSAATYHVYPTDPIISVASTISSAPAGSTIYVHSGTYLGPAPTITITNNNITIIGDDPSTTIFDGIGPILVSSSSISGITIKNLTLRNISAPGIYLTGANINGVNIQNCIIHSSGPGISISSTATSNVLIENCLIYGSANQGISINGTMGVTNTLIRNCTSHGNMRGISLIGYGMDATIENCIVSKSTIFGIEVTGTSPVTSTLTVKNTNTWGSLVANNNIFLGPSGTLTLVNNISEDPLYVDGINTFYLSNSSPCVDSGSTSSKFLGLYNGFTTMTDGRWDTGTVDMGFHYTSNRGPLAVLPIEKILQIVKENQED